MERVSRSSFPSSPCRLWGELECSPWSRQGAAPGPYSSSSPGGEGRGGDTTPTSIQSLRARADPGRLAGFGEFKSFIPGHAGERRSEPRSLTMAGSATRDSGLVLSSGPAVVTHPSEPTSEICSPANRGNFMFPVTAWDTGYRATPTPSAPVFPGPGGRTEARFPPPQEPLPGPDPPGPQRPQARPRWLSLHPAASSAPLLCQWLEPPGGTPRTPTGLPGPPPHPLSAPPCLPAPPCSAKGT